MKRPSLPRALSGFFLIFLMLFSLAAVAARLEVDRNEMAVGEITTVHLKGAPLIAVVDWKVSPELEIVESNSKRARVRGVREGAGTVKCEMNLNVHSVAITVRGAAAAAVPTAPAAAPVPAAQPVYPAPAYTPPAYSAPAYATPSAPAPVAAAKANLAGTWQINAAGYQGKLELSSTQGLLIGRVWFDAHAAWEPLEDLYFDEAIGELSFGRPGANQSYRGRLQGNALEGQFTQWGGRDYSASTPTYPWSATRSGAAAPTPATMPAMRPARISEFSWQGMNEDRVGDWGNGRPNGTPDGRFRLTLELPNRMAITSISLWSADEKGGKAGGQVWHSRSGSYWMLGVFRDGRQLNGSHVASLGEHSGNTVFDLYANSSGWFKPGQTFLVEVETADGRIGSQTLRLAKPAAQASGLIAHLTMDGRVIEQVSGIPASNHGAQPTRDRQGRDGGALLFDGKSYLEIGLDINPAKRPQLTIAAWVRADSDQPIQQVASHDNGGYDRSLNIDYRGGGNGWSAFAGSGAVLGVKPVQVGNWTFVAATWDQAVQRVRLYVDGNQFEKSGSSGDGHAFLRIGMNPSYGEYFKGAIDELWVFDKALGPDELGRLRGSAPSGGNAGGLAGPWSINANGYTGKLELSESGGRLSGRVWFDAHQVWEELREISFDGRTLRFLRPGPSQLYTGTLSGNEVRGTFTGGGAWNWVITRAGPASPATASGTDDALQDVMKQLKGLFK